MIMTATTGGRRRPGPAFRIADLVTGDCGPFAVLYRPEATGPDRLELLTGDLQPVARLDDLPLGEAAGAGPVHELLVVLPYRQISERGFACRDDGEPVLAMTVRRQATISVAEAMRAVPHARIDVREDGFDVDDDRYADLVRRVVAGEIGRGEGSNFVIRRALRGRLTGYSPRVALALFGRLLAHEPSAYWTFLVHTGERTFLGATPERHVTLDAGTMTMNPISGTYRYPDSGPTLEGVLGFLSDQKETDELYMVVDEELKMMARACERGGRVVGPRLKQMADLAHTEYLLHGRTRLDVRHILRETMFAPTVTGSPLESACRVISRHEERGRGYYSGALALLGWDGHGQRALDSAIIIRTADIDRSGRFEIGLGATLVRHSDPAAEAAETRAKAAGLLAALRGTAPRPGRARARLRTANRAAPRLDAHRSVQQALADRNTGLAPFWLDRSDPGSLQVAALAARRVLVVDAEDTFTAMLAHQLRALGPDVTVRPFDEVRRTAGYDVVLIGPGPGDPADTAHPKIKTLRDLTVRLLDARVPLLAVCLGHQILAALLGLRLVRLPHPHQGAQRDIDLFGRPERVGFYNTFTAFSTDDEISSARVRGPIRICRDPATGHVHALRGDRLASMQFHPESVLTGNGPGILAEALTGLLASGDPPVACGRAWTREDGPC
jgi:phenazine biosynthesis protein phzE